MVGFGIYLRFRSSYRIYAAWCPAITVVYSPDEDNDDATSDSDDNDDAAVAAAATKMIAMIEIMIILMTAVLKSL